MIIEKALPEELAAIRTFYYGVTDGLEDSDCRPGWKKDIYPAPDQLRSLIENGELYTGKENGAIIAAMAMNHDCNEGYEKAPWQVDAAGSEVFVLHILAVLPSRGRSGLGSEMVRFAIANARQQNARVIRLDVLKGNYPANRLYEAAGFQKRHTLSMYYPDTGWTDFELYELVL